MANQDWTLDEINAAIARKEGKKQPNASPPTLDEINAAIEKKEKRAPTAFENLVEYEKYLFPRMAQSAINTGEVVAELPGDVSQALFGRGKYRLPRASFANQEAPTQAGRAAQSVGDFTGGFLLPGGPAAKGYTLLASALRKGLPELAAKGLAGVGMGALTGAAVDENRGSGATLGAALGAIPGAISAGKGAYNLASKGIQKGIDTLTGRDALKEALEKMINLQGAEKKTKELVEGARNLGNETIGNYQQNLRQNQSANAERMQRIFPQKTKADARIDLYQNVDRKRKETYRKYKDQYKGFSDIYGKQEINRPLTNEDLSKLLPNNTQRTQREGSKYLGTQQELEIINPSTGENIVIDFPSENDHNIDNYQNLFRQARDAENIAKTQAQLANEQALKQKYREQASAAKNLKENAEKRINETLPPEAQSLWKKIQKGYSEEYLPFISIPSVYKTWASGGRKFGKNMFDEMLNPAYSKFRENVTGDTRLKNAILGHEVSQKKHPLSLKTIEQQGERALTLLQEDSDLAKLFSPQQIKALQSHAALGQRSKELKELRKVINSKDFANFVNNDAVQSWMDINPKIRKLIEGATSEEEKLKAIKQAANQQKISVEQMKENVKQYEKRLNLFKKVAIGGALLAGGGTGAKRYL